MVKTSSTVMRLNLQPLRWVIETVRPNPVSGGPDHRFRALEHLRQFLAPRAVAFRLADLVHDDRTSLAARRAAAALLRGFEVQQLAGLQVTGISRFRD